MQEKAPPIVQAIADSHRGREKMVKAIYIHDWIQEYNKRIKSGEDRRSEYFDEPKDRIRFTSFMVKLIILCFLVHIEDDPPSCWCIHLAATRSFSDLK